LYLDSPNSALFGPARLWFLVQALRR